jgi:predicted nucleic acid-binding protein
MAMLVFDSSPLSCFARSGRLVLLEKLTAGYERVTTRAVVHELEQGCSGFPLLRDALALPWIRIVPVDGVDEPG